MVPGYRTLEERSRTMKIWLMGTVAEMAMCPPKIYNLFLAAVQMGLKTGSMNISEVKFFQEVVVKR